MALAVHARLWHRGCRLLDVSSIRNLGTGARQTFRSGVVVAERGSSNRAEERRGTGGRRDGREDRGSGREQTSIWGDDWNIGGGQAAGKASDQGGSGWLDADKPSDVGYERRGSHSGMRGGSAGRQQRDNRGSTQGDWRERRDGTGGGNSSRGDWRERRDGGGRDAATADWRQRERGGSARGEWRDRRDGGGGGGSKGEWQERRNSGNGGEGRRENRDGRAPWSGGEGRWGDREGRGGDAASRFSERRDQSSYQRRDGGSGSWGRRGDRWEGGRDSSRRFDRWQEEREGAAERDDHEAEESGGGGGLRQYWIGDVLYGVSPVLAALQAGRRTVHTLYLQEGMDLSKRKDKGAIQTAKQRATELGAAVQYASKHDLNMVADNRPHQGLVLDCSPLDFEPMNTLPDAPSFTDAATSATDARLPVWLCLDEVADPQNFGAALRSAYFLGATGVLTCHRNSAPLSAAVSKASAGTMELLPIHSCKSLPQTLADAKSRGWLVLGAAAEAGAVGCSSFVLNQPAILVMGNEGYGLRTTVRRLCDVMLQIDDGGVGRQGMVDSLNVSVATGILLHRLLTAQEPAGSGTATAGAAAPTQLLGITAAAAAAAGIGAEE